MARKSSFAQYSFDEAHLRLLQDTYLQGALESIIASVGAKMGLGRKMNAGVIDDDVSAVDERMPYILHKFKFESKWESYLHKCIHRIMINELFRNKAPRTFSGRAEKLDAVFNSVLDSHGPKTPNEMTSEEEHERQAKPCKSDDAAAQPQARVHCR